MSKKERLDNFAGEVHKGVLSEFAGTVEFLEILPEDVSGKVMVIGHAYAFPERIWICTPESKFSEIRPEISQMICLDSESYTMPDILLRDKMVRRQSGSIGEKELEKNTFFQSPSGFLLPKLEEAGVLMDVVMMFRISNMKRQFGGMLSFLDGVMEVGGRFMGSGSFESEEEVSSHVNSSEWEVIKTATLYNPDLSGYLYSPRHVGFVLEKKVSHL